MYSLFWLYLIFFKCALLKKNCRLNETCECGGVWNGSSFMQTYVLFWLLQKTSEAIRRIVKIKISDKWTHYIEKKLCWCNVATSTWQICFKNSECWRLVPLQIRSWTNYFNKNLIKFVRYIVKTKDLTDTSFYVWVPSCMGTTT